MFYHPGQNANPLVVSHLPESFGFGVGSRYSDPFAKFTHDDTIHALFTVATGRSLNAAVMTKKVFVGPEQPDITLELKFEAYHSAEEEVLKPVQQLMLMATGTEAGTIGEIAQTGAAGSALANGAMSIANAGDGLGSSLGITKEGQIVNAAKSIKLSHAPSAYTVYIGNTVRIPQVYLQNVHVNFSNTLDHRHIPMAADVTVTLVPERPLMNANVMDLFKADQYAA